MASLEHFLAGVETVVLLLKDLVHNFAPCKVGVEVIDYVTNRPNDGLSLEQAPSLPPNERDLSLLVHDGVVITNTHLHSLVEVHL